MLRHVPIAGPQSSPPVHVAHVLSPILSPVLSPVPSPVFPPVFPSEALAFRGAVFLPAIQTPTQSLPPKPEIVDDARFTEGDFALVSSDNVRFRVASHHLMAASVSGTGERTVHLTDTEIESAEIVRHFLQLLVYGHLAAPPEHDAASGRGAGPSQIILDHFDVAHLIFFLQKYECEQWVRLAVYTLHQAWSLDEVGSLQLFSVGSFCTGTPTGLLSGDLATALDVRGFDYATWSLIPRRYQYAITKALTVVEKLNTRKKRGEIFLQLVED